MCMMRATSGEYETAQRKLLHGNLLALTGGRPDGRDCLTERPCLTTERDEDR